ncbi:ATP:corrinoid adenosyltransferase (BtuR) (PDB:4HUT) [Commensalibacter communis]|uniref:Corrinoid adenosyltransferase n=1 Tax=Commensalibacter communis TaxID=2972786 RepID=A0A9W4X7B9_9PROT|nr:cob(I)yrinic acid a,c-diamide adenosyltransferase [Commensalibacter communis]CAI3949873.1 ATP:corrinoid adenosyltransferase (BtuR) (PDB:4HUT) [Commensalibacter communis]CAI3953189.1 ATP:corrinoid adenosyltransferase (BtuR) (PDB:4HUT) [Commensalibacter communis]CAI3953896.1 ATP:corrinoid adenosyltransferase (BtuR) (PDB:4HUT) [Commensalibacter communis]CAI3953954.1 ATP:corrinoid adenosyltransferase (BtuR) (PDB:4HUT) [Commensalibacter communis]CAI3955808.1 ATP:corrinoid adenosyltransferase (Bt
MTDHDAELHKKKMQKRKELQTELVSSKIETKGLVMVHTGSGKGKSTAAFGLVFRNLGYGRKCAVIQFIKAPEWQTGERKMGDRFPDLLEWHTLGEGFTWDTQDKQKDIASCAKAWDVALKYLQDEEIALVVLDELNIALRYDYITVETVLEGLRNRPAMQHVVITGRNAKQALIDAADLVTEMNLVKHHFEAGVKAQKGVEF